MFMEFMQIVEGGERGEVVEDNCSMILEFLQIVEGGTPDKRNPVSLYVFGVSVGSRERGNPCKTYL